jgi:hypothetical protein
VRFLGRQEAGGPEAVRSVRRWARVDLGQGVRNWNRLVGGCLVQDLRGANSFFDKSRSRVANEDATLRMLPD